MKKLKKVHLLLAILVLGVSGLEARTVFNQGNPDAKRLYDDLLSNYNKLVRPVVNTTDPLTVRIKLKLSQLIDVVSCLFPRSTTQKCIVKKSSRGQLLVYASPIRVAEKGTKQKSAIQ